ncbi:hypothetical protein MMA231_04134 (plasmid) [Asticcacaulis sp. MM231]|jgi:hypothetical protein|uniref:hypothetical protein n=1 Tax=Asticcacaulis sp. MM231 TaxID=3157666 RepID=UPI0032D57E9E
MTHALTNTRFASKHVAEFAGLKRLTTQNALLTAFVSRHCSPRSGPERKYNPEEPLIDILVRLDALVHTQTAHGNRAA